MAWAKATFREARQVSSLDESVRTISKQLDALGISTAAVIFRDPDSESIVSMRRGDPCWLSGALRMAEQEVTDNWVVVRRPVDMG
jgi:hypothetical protein